MGQLESSMGKRGPIDGSIRVIDGEARYHRWVNSSHRWGSSIPSMGKLDTIDGEARYHRWVKSSHRWGSSIPSWLSSMSGTFNWGDRAPFRAKHFGVRWQSHRFGRTVESGRY